MSFGPKVLVFRVGLWGFKVVSLGVCLDIGREITAVSSRLTDG